MKLQTAIVLITLNLLILPCAAKGVYADQPVTTSPINCDALSGGDLVCVKNLTHNRIKEITCDGHFFGTANISVPGGSIPSGGIGIVDFNKGACGSGITIITSDGKQHRIPGQDVKKLTILTIESDEW